MPRAKILTVAAAQYCAGYLAVMAIWAVATSDYFRASVLIVVALVSLIPFLLGLARTTSVAPPDLVRTVVLGALIALGFVALPYLIHEIWPNAPKLSRQEFYGNMLGLLFLILGPLAAGWFLSTGVAHSNSAAHPDAREASRAGGHER